MCRYSMIIRCNRHGVIAEPQFMTKFAVGEYGLRCIAAATMAHPAPCLVWHEVHKVLSNSHPRFAGVK